MAIFCGFSLWFYPDQTCVLWYTKPYHKISFFYHCSTVLVHTKSEFIDPWLGDIVNSGIGLSYRHARSMNSATGLACSSLSMIQLEWLFLFLGFEKETFYARKTHERCVWLKNKELISEETTIFFFNWKKSHFWVVTFSDICSLLQQGGEFIHKITNLQNSKCLTTK